MAGVDLPTDTSVLVTGGLGLVFQPMADAVVTMVAGLDRAAMLVLDVNCRPVAVDDHTTYRRRVLEVAARADVVKASDEDLTTWHSDRRRSSRPRPC